jgi:hypothetical protein
MARLRGEFDRHHLPFKTSLIRQITRGHLTHINDVFWMHEKSYAVIENAWPSLPEPKKGPFVRDVFQSDESWRKGAAALRLWFRQNVIVSAASILEVYIISACTIAFSAEPSLINRSLEGIDGAAFVKHPDTLPSRFRRTIKQRAEDLTKGEWTDRLKKIEMEVGKIPLSVSSMVESLQDLQNKRNRIAHSYGAEGELPRTPWEPITAITVTDAEILEIFRMVDIVSKDFDKHLFGPLIGGFELLNEYHSWLTGPESASTFLHKDKVLSTFRKHLGNAFGTTPGSAYIRTMVEYYDKIKPPSP